MVSISKPYIHIKTGTRSYADIRYLHCGGDIQHDPQFQIWGTFLALRPPPQGRRRRHRSAPSSPLSRCRPAPTLYGSLTVMQSSCEDWPATADEIRN